MGNRDEMWAPHNCYRCLGDDQWLSIAVTNEQEWQALVVAMSNPEWAGDEKFSTLAQRWQHQDELDRLIEGWTCQRTTYEAMHLLQEYGVAAFPSMDGKQLYEDPHLNERGVWQKMTHKALGEQVVIAPPWKLSETPAKIKNSAPLFGEHNAYVLGELLGLSAEKISGLVEEKVVW